MLYRSVIARIIENYVKKSQLNQSNSLARYINLICTVANCQYLNNLIDVFNRFLSTKMSDDFNVFNGTVDRYNGITIDTEIEAIGDEFSDKLKST